MSREPSYYEIALTQRQVVIAFVILLVCLVVAFFSGLWVGSGARLGANGEEAQVARAAGQEADDALPEATAGPLTGRDGKVAVGADDEGDGDGVERLRFFSDEDDSSGSSHGGSVGDGDSATETQAARPPAAQPPAAPSEPARTPPAEARPAVQTEPTPTDRPLPPGRTRVESPVQPPPEPPVTVDPRDTEPGGDGPVIQVFASHNQAQAQEVLDRLLRADLDAYLAPAVVDGITQYRVRLGPFRSREQAEDVAAQLREDLKLETWITRP